LGDPSPSLSWELALLAALFVGSFCFSGTETALTSLGEAQARKLREQLGERGRRLDLWIAHPSKVLAVLLVGNNLMNTAASAVATALALQSAERMGVPHPEALAITTGVMTMLLLIFGEITPKTLARERAEKIALPAITLLTPLYYLLHPLAWALERLARGVSRVLGHPEQRPIVSEEDVEYYIGLSAAEGSLDGMKKDLLTSVVEFTDLVVKEIMIPRTQMVALAVSTSPRDALGICTSTGHSRFPVYGEDIDDIVGILSVKDLTRVLVGREGDRLPDDLRPLLRDVLFVPEVKPVTELMRTMQSGRTHIAVVVDEFGGTSGIVTLEDVVEEIVGDIHDEHDVEDQPVMRLPDGGLLVVASVNLRDLEDDVPLEFPDDGDYESLGGFLTATAGRMPKQGERVTYGGFDFIVRSADARRVLRVEIRPTERPAPEGAGDEGAAQADAEGASREADPDGVASAV